MSAQIVHESRLFVGAIAIGAELTIFYDLFRIARRVVIHNGFFIAVEDLFYWIVTSVILFRWLYYMNDGVIRWFLIVGIYIGTKIYQKFLGEHIVCFMSTILKRTLDIVNSLILRIFRPFLWVKKKLTGNIKLVKITLCKHISNHAKVGRNHDSKDL